MKRLSILCAMLAIGSLFLGGVIADCQANNVEILESYTKIQTSSVRDLCEGSEIEVNYTKIVPNNGSSLLPGKSIHVVCYLENDTTAVYDAYKSTSKTTGAVFYNLPAGQCMIQASGIDRALQFNVKEDPNKYTIEEAVLETSAPEEEEPPEMEEEEPKDLINSTREQLESNETWNGVAGYIISLMLF